MKRIDLTDAEVRHMLMALDAAEACWDEYGVRDHADFRRVDDKTAANAQGTVELVRRWLSNPSVHRTPDTPQEVFLVYYKGQFDGHVFSTRAKALAWIDHEVTSRAVQPNTINARAHYEIFQGVPQ